ncbi:MAG: DUF3999 family protein [Pontiellaceae bacterium]|nr:DUF3999 family protein [Pontiellaceae bacterium]MBN2783370.1 DUF3999 family protein [Pontiellaceae bacterium]
MKIRITLITCLLALSAGAENLPARFELMQPLSEYLVPQTQAKILIPDHVFGQSRNFPNDVRIFDEDGTQWPCFLYVPKETVKAESVGLAILNTAWVDGDAPYLQFDILIPKVNGAVPVHNRIELRTTGSDFVRRVEIFKDTASGGHMASGYLLEFPSRNDAHNRVIRYPDADVGRLHVRIYPNAQAAGETFDISDAHLQYCSEVTVDYEPVLFESIAVPEREQTEGAQTQILDIGNARRPVERVRFSVSDDSYARCVSVYGRNDEHEPWNRVGGGEIHALPDDRNDEIKLHACARYIKVVVYHHDDRPLNIAAVKLEAVPRYLVFEAQSARPATLYYRAWDMPAPRFDLKSRMDNVDMKTLPLVMLETARSNDLAKTNPFRKHGRLLAGVAVGAVSLLVVWIIVGMLRNPPPAGSKES